MQNAENTDVCFGNTYQYSSIKKAENNFDLFISYVQCIKSNEHNRNPDDEADLHF